MNYCQRCDTEYERDDRCLCFKYKRLMEQGLTFMVPNWWIRDWWDGPIAGDMWKNHARKPSQ